MRSRKANWQVVKKAKRVYLLRMHLGLYKGLPKQTLTTEQQTALFLANQKNRTLTRVPGAQFRLVPSVQPSTISTP